jgi:hypothetical protein
VLYTENRSKLINTGITNKLIRRKTMSRIDPPGENENALVITWVILVVVILYMSCHIINGIVDRKKAYEDNKPIPGYHDSKDNGS